MFTHVICKEDTWQMLIYWQNQIYVLLFGDTHVSMLTLQHDTCQILALGFVVLLQMYLV